MILAIVRHGQTDYNLNRLVQGRMDNKLNTNGKNQTFQMGVHLKDLGDQFDVLGASPLSRARESAEIIGNLLNLKLTFIEPDFTERNFGPFEGKSIDEVLPLITKDDFSYPGYESNADLTLRVHQGVKKLHRRFGKKNVLFVAHSHVIKSLLILADPTKNFLNHPVLNSSIIYFDVEPNRIRFVKQIDLN